MPAALELRNVHKSFGKTAIINGVDLAIEKGERHAVSAPESRSKGAMRVCFTPKTASLSR